MKIRSTFVSNSSSSSFICEISGEEYTGFDCGLVIDVLLKDLKV